MPFLTPRFAELVLSLPESYLVDEEGTSKRVFREAMRGIVPDAILDRRDKIGFATPEKAWMMRSVDWVREVLNGDAGRAAGPIDREGALRYLDQAKRGLLQADRRVWRWTNLVEWSRLFGVTFD